MGDEFQLGSGNWWDNSRNRSFDSGTTPSSISTTLNTIASYGSWPPETDLNKSVSTTAGGGHDHSAATDQNLQMMGLGLSSQNLDWNQALLGEKVETSFRSLLQADDFQPKLYSVPSSEDSSVNRPGFSLDQTAPFSSQANSNDSTITTGFQVDFQGMMLSENQQQQQSSYNQSRSSTNYQYSPSGGYGADQYMHSLNKYPQFLRTSQTPPVTVSGGSSHLHFTNNTPFWNASGPVPADARSGFYPVVGHQIPTQPSFDHDMKSNHNTSELGDLSKKKKSNSPETSNKRARVLNQTPPPPMPPPFKVRKEKMGDRITALQQLVSPFGKTDTASVLSEAIAYIKFLHEQVSVLSNPYLKNGAPTQHQQNCDHKAKEAQGACHDLRSRGLCLVPVSSTFPMTQETTVDFWTPTYGGTFR